MISFLVLNGVSRASSGVITPAKTSIQISGLYFLDMSMQTISVADTFVPDGGTAPDGGIQTVGRTITLNAADPDFSSFPFGTLSVPEGRFVGIGLAVDNRQRWVTLDGTYQYLGSDTNSPGNIKNGYYLCSTGTATDGSGIMGSPTPAGGSFCSSPAELTILSNSSASTVVTTSYFAQPVCITTPDQQLKLCQKDDTFIDATNTANLTVTILFDLFDSMTVANTDPNLGPDQPYKLFAGSYPFAILGDAGASAHLVVSSTLNGDGTTNKSGARSVGDITVLLDGAKKLIYTNAVVRSDTMCNGSFVSGCSARNIAGLCSGQAYRRVTATPSGMAPSPFADQVAQFDPATGKVAFEASEIPIDASPPFDPAGRGINLVGPIINLSFAAGKPPKVAVNCVADDDAVALAAWDAAFQPYLGYAYPAGAGNAFSGAPGYNSSFALAKVVDPKGLLGESGTDCVAGKGCGSYPQLTAP
jgi:hypothetical protein